MAKRHCVVISDTHGYHNSLDIPMCDILLHCGDYSTSGTFREFLDFIHWFSGLTQCKDKVFIAGNHDLIMENGNSYKNKKPNPELKKMCVEICRRLNIHYLENSKVQLQGLTIYGSPNSPKFGDWGFPMKDIEEERKIYSKIPKNTDILLTHCPPRAILDIGGRNWQHLGSIGLQEAALKKKPKYHCFGHIHESFGETRFHDINFINASYCGMPYNRLNDYKEFYIEVGNEESVPK